MTYSLLVKDPQSGFFGVAVAGKFFAVDALCPWSSPAGDVELPC